MRSQFTFYKSFDDVLEDLNDKQIAEYLRKMLDVQFLRVRIDDVYFEDKLLSVIWKSQKHSIKSSINGYLDSQKRESCKEPYLGCYDYDFIPYKGGCEAPYEGGLQQDKEKGKEEGKVKGKKFSYNLGVKTSYSNLSSLYKQKLKEDIELFNGKLSYDNFVLQLESKGYKYANFLSAYKNWETSAKDKPINKPSYKSLEDLPMEERMIEAERIRQEKEEANMNRILGL